MSFTNGRTSPERTDDGLVPVFGSNGLIGYAHTSNAPRQTTVIGRVGTYCGSLHFAREASWVTDNAIKAIANTHDEARFWYYALMSADLSRLRSGSGQPLINQRSLNTVELPIPARQERLAIATVLGSLDDKIELNQRMNETLEAMAQAIFRDWFVDFGPTRRKIDGATDPVEIMGGLVRDPHRARELADLFPAKMGDNGLPEGWSYSSLGEVFNITIGRTPPRKEQQHFTSAGDGVPWMSIRDLGDCGVFIQDTAEGLTSDAVGRFRVPLIEPDTVVVSFKLTVGRVAITERRMLSNEAIAHLGATSCTQSPWFTYLWMQQFDYSRLGSTSSIAIAVNSKSIKMIEFPIVGAALLSAFHDLVDPVFCMIRSKSSESRTLAATRDLLLPKLMSGEIRLRDAERMIEAVA